MEYKDLLFGPIMMLRQTLRDEISYIVLRVLAGLVLTSVIVYAIFNAGDAFSILAQQYENGYIYELIGFSVLAVVASVGLYFLFRPIKKVTTAAISFDLLVIKIIENFADGFADGIQSAAADKNSELHTIKYSDKDIKEELKLAKS